MPYDLLDTNRVVTKNTDHSATGQLTVIIFAQLPLISLQLLSPAGSSNIFGPVSKESWEANTLSFLAKQGESFMDMVCRDACNGPEIGEV